MLLKYQLRNFSSTGKLNMGHLNKQNLWLWLHYKTKSGNWFKYFSDNLKCINKSKLIRLIEVLIFIWFNLCYEIDHLIQVSVDLMIHFPQTWKLQQTEKF